MNNCRICGSLLGEPVYSSGGPSISSVRTVIDVPLSAFLCPECSHTQKPALQNSADYYDKRYRISLTSKDFDQVYDVVDGKCIYRTDYQSEVILKTTSIAAGSKVLDYGAGKASTLKKITAARPDIVPYVFDVSEDYMESWGEFLPKDRQAAYQIPESWNSTFSLVTAHFVLEHAEDPCEVLSNISQLLSPDGTLFFSVPNLLSNPGDLLAVDHVNHYSFDSINVALARANLTLVSVDENIFRGAIICVAKRKASPTADTRRDGGKCKDEIERIAVFWSRFDRLLEEAASLYTNVPSAIYGAGLYGTYIASKIAGRVSCECFLDKSPHLIGGEHMGLPIKAPCDLPSNIRVMYAGLNPNIARSALDLYKTRGIENIIYFDDGES
ncbi:hypothetical protein DRJ17_06795 [Candidatus Woesearchaeota archaeon]|nr:MAG: hypothetical protein DRJ17_06795 [Candidatus Woesearchaeota archaeon]